MVLHFLTKLEKNPVETVVESTNNELNDQIQVCVDQLNAVVEQMKMEMDQLQQISKFNQNSMHQLKHHGEQTNSYTQKVKENMSHIQSSSVEVASISNQVLEASISSEADLEKAMADLQSLNGKIDKIHTGHQQLLKQMDALAQHSVQTIAIVDTIGAISQKTRILALNASIEAARAGVHGKGFNVVANEVGKLANLTAEAVSQTGRNLKFIQEEIRTSTSMVKEEAIQVEDGVVEIKNVMESFHTLQNKLTHIQLVISETNGSVSTQTSNIDEITTLLNDISNMSTENLNQVYGVSGELDKQHEVIEGIVHVTSSLTNTSNELQHLVLKDDSTQLNINSERLEGMKRKLKELLENPALLQLDVVSHKQLFHLFLQKEKEVEAIWSNRTDGTFIYSNPPEGIVNAKARPWFKQAMEGEVYVSEAYVSALTKTKCITISCPIMEKGEVVGVLGVDMAL